MAVIKGCHVGLPEERNSLALNQMLDRNKTKITHDVTIAACDWLRDIGAKCVEAEVPICQKWIADLAAFWSPTYTEARKQKLISKAPSTSVEYDESLKDYKVIATGDKNGWNKTWEQIPRRITIISEVKTSRPDFLKDRESKFSGKPMADMQVLNCVRGIVKEEERPANWWVIEHSPDTGRVIKVVKRSPFNSNITMEDRYELISNIAERMHNRVANHHFIELMKKQRMELRERRIESKVSNIISMVMDIVGGMPIDEAIEQWGVKCDKNTIYKLRELEELSR